VPLPTGGTLGTPGYGVAAAAFLPIVPARDNRRGGTVGITADASYSRALADQWTRLQDGLTLPDPTATAAAPGLFGQASTGSIEPVAWLTAEACLEWHVTGETFFALGAGAVRAPSIRGYAGQPFDESYRGNASIVTEITEWLRIGAEASRTTTVYTTGQRAANDRAQLTFLFMF
jgi:hypothetical protein